MLNSTACREDPKHRRPEAVPNCSSTAILPCDVSFIGAGGYRARRHEAHSHSLLTLGTAAARVAQGGHLC
jgi:hypothetical protein